MTISKVTLTSKGSSELEKGQCKEHVGWNIDPHQKGPVPTPYHSVNKGN
jgi:hypothetical protein